MSFFKKFWKWLTSIFFSKELTITIIGLPGAGKTTLVRAMSNEDTEAPVVPTIGARASSVKIGNIQFNIRDIGGHKTHQTLWEYYYESSNIVIYVVDSSDEEAISTSESQLETILENENLTNIPFLIVANKQDLPESLPANDIISRLKLQNIEDRNLHLFCVSAKMKTNISEIIQWMIENT